MTVETGEIFGIVGGSGAGKSVLLRSILGLQRPLAGTVRLNGEDITRMTQSQMRAIKAGYGVTFQEGALFSALTVLTERAAADARISATAERRPG